MANFEDFPPIFCLTADFLPQGGGRILVKYSPVPVPSCKNIVNQKDLSDPSYSKICICYTVESKFVQTYYMTNPS